MNKRILAVLIGNLIIGLAIGVSVYCDFGIDPSTTFFMGISYHIPIGFGNVVALSNAIFFIPMYYFDKSTIHIGSFINMFGIGYVVEFTSQWMFSLPIEYSLPLRVMLFILAIIFICIGVGLYLSANLGQAPWDACAHIISTRHPHISYGKARMVQDVIALAIGFILGVQLGIGSFILAFCLGPGINFSKKYFTKLLFKTV